MIRSLAALFAKKTAIVAITGVTVIGGATFALAVEDAPAGEQEPTEDTQDTTTTTDDPTTTTTTEPTTTTSEAPTTSTPESTTTTEPDDHGSDDERLTTSADGDLDGDADADAEDSHGVMVSDAARNICHKPENIAAYGNHGQCVKAFAHGEGVDHSEVVDPAPAAAPATSDSTQTAAETVMEPAPVTQQVTKSAPPAGKGKPAHAEGKGNGGGKGKKS